MHGHEDYALNTCDSKAVVLAHGIAEFKLFYYDVFMSFKRYEDY